MRSLAGYEPRVSGDVIENIYEMELEGEVFVIKRREERIEFFVKGQNEPMGLLVFGGPNSGAIWFEDDFVGEFERTKEKFVITPVVNGRRLDDTIQMNPIIFLLSKKLDRA